MWKDIGKLFIRLISVVLPVCLFLMLYAALFPMYYLDPEYAMYKQQKDVITGNIEAGENIKTIVIGDSRAKAAFMPEYLSDDCYNLALGGTTPIEGFYTLKEYLGQYEAPEYLILCYAPMHYEDKDTLWTRSIYFHMINDEDMMEIFDIANGCEVTDNILIEDYFKEWLMYRTYMPNKYCTAIRNSVFSDRYKENKAKYEYVTAHRGQAYFGTEDENGGVNGEAKEERFIPSDVITIYLEKIFDLCRENNIKVIIEQTPMNETSLKIIDRQYRHDFKDYMDMVEKMDENALVYDYFYEYPNSYFGDADHLNEQGVKEYCIYLNEAYPEVFD
ncbi:MAG TPA: hypothetical protein DCG85_05275 [Lachnospiraceae bacterium]|nr:hypothetical protein [Lachnospiraceae bacterium]